MKTLWLASWYPSRISPFNGDFIKRHAEAVSQFEEVQVIHVIRDENGSVTKDVLVEESVTGNLAETIIYYHTRKRRLSMLDKYFSEKKFRLVYREAIKKYVSREGKPALVHVHVGMKSGVMAIELNKSAGIPYVVSEHWSGFLPGATDTFRDLPFYYRKLWKRVMNRSAGCSAVSNALANGIQHHFPGTHCRVIPNVVNTAIFKPASRQRSDPRFIHISGLQELKNPTDIIRAFRIVRNEYPAAHLSIVGSTRDDIVAFANELGLQDSVSFSDEVPQPVLSNYISQADALLLYSSFETFGCVIIEANACGIPVIVSDIPVFHETVTEGKNGFFVPPANPQALADAMILSIKNRPLFDSNAISTTTGLKYGYASVGKQFSDWYKEVARN